MCDAVHAPARQDVGPLRKNLESANVGEGYGEFLDAVDSLMACEPALDRSKISPMMLEAWNFVYDTAKLKVKKHAWACGASESSCYPGALP